jgi:multicomponent K+:H+ antiporter subunit G
MSDAALPPAVAALVALLVVLGAALALLGSLGLLRLPTFYERVHPPTMGTTLGTGFVLAASMLLFSVLESRPVLHEIVIAVFVIVTTPVTYMLLVRAAVHRDRTDREKDTQRNETDVAAMRED